MKCTRSITYYLRKLVFVMDKLADQAFDEKKLGVSFAQFRLLMAIDNKTVCQREIAKYWQMTEAAVSRQIEALIEEKFITKKENPGNRRQHLLVLSPKGKAVLEKGLNFIDEEYGEIYQVLTETERVQLEQHLGKMLSNLCSPTRNEDHKEALPVPTSY